MTSPVTKAMIESYALMIMVMGTFFVYFCGMVWAFCNPKLSGEEEAETGKQSVYEEDGCWLCAPDPSVRNPRCVCTRGPAPPYIAEQLTQSTYINFWDDTDSLLSECTAFCREDRRMEGIQNVVGESNFWVV